MARGCGGRGRPLGTRARSWAAGPQDISAVIQSSLIPGLGPDSPRVSMPWLVVPLGPERLGTHGRRQVGTASRRQASLPVCAGTRPSWGSGASPAPKLACVSFSFAVPAPCIRSLAHPLSWTLTGLDSDPHSLGAVGRS